LVTKHSAFREWQDTLLWIAGTTAPTDAEWDVYTAVAVTLGERLKLEGRPLQVMVVTDGSAPNAPQRSSFLAATQGIPVRTAVVSSSAFARGVVTVFSWFKMDTKCFAPREVEASFDFLRLEPSDRPKLWAELEQLQSELGHTRVKAISEARGFLKSVVVAPAARERRTESR
jgi:hypothetical protein